MTTPLMRRPRERKPWGLILALVIASVAGLVSIPLNVAVFRNVEGLPRAEVEQNQRLIEQVRMIVQSTGEDAQADHNCIVALALLLADPQRDRGVEPKLPDECADSPALTPDTAVPEGR